MNLKDAKRVHMIGIGGIGMSALARMLVSKEIVVTGSDNHPGKITEGLQELGIEISFEQIGAIPSGTEYVVYTVAIPESNPERMYAKEHKIPSCSYPEGLSAMSEGYEVIAVAGTHGKTTTTAMCAHAMKENRLDPTVIVGSLLAESGVNFIQGKSKYLVVEACEYKRSFLNLNPVYLIITNIESDHLDYYKDIDDIVSAFHDLAQCVPEYGVIVADTRSETVAKALTGVTAPVLSYESIEETLRVPGAHNRANAGAIVTLLTHLGVSKDKSVNSLKTFNGTWRRFEYKGVVAGGATLYDDYAHHPTEIRATLAGACELFPEKNVVAVFEPHLFSRTKQLFDEFVTSFDSADEVCFTPIYPAREKDDGSINSRMLATAVSEHGKNSQSFTSFDEARVYLETKGEDTVIITMGAGDIYTLADELVKK